MDRRLNMAQRLLLLLLPAVLLAQCPDQLPLECKCDLFPTKTILCESLGTLDVLPFLGITDMVFDRVEIGAGSVIKRLNSEPLSGLFMEELVLSGVGLESITASAFLFHEDTLLRLRLDNNRLSTIERGTFAGLQKLIELKLSGNQLDEISDHHFETLSSLTILDLSDNEIGTVSKQAFSSLDALEKLYLHGNRLGALEEGLFGANALPRLAELYLHENRITNVDSTVFRGMRQLKKINLSGNEITDLDEDIFNENFMLVSVSLADNRLTAISPKLLYPTLQLRELDLSNNRISSLERSVFTTLRSIRTLDLSGNQLRTLPNQLIENTHLLAHLNLKGNKLNLLPELALDGASVLQVLDLSYNAFTEINPLLLDRVSALHELHLSHNLLTVLPNRFFSALHQLHTLNLDHNKLRAVDSKLLHSDNNLSFLNLSHNAITYIDAEGLRELKNLTTLDFSFNEITQLNESALSDLTVLKFLSLAHNPLVEVSKLPSTLREVHMNNTCLSELSSGIFSSSLSHLYLQNNLFASLPSDLFDDLNTLEVLDLSWNNLTNLEEIEAHLLLLNISHNSFKSIPSLPNTESIDLSFNLLDNPSSIQQQLDLQPTISLDVDYNLIKCDSCGLLNINGLDKPLHCQQTDNMYQLLSACCSSEGCSGEGSEVVAVRPLGPCHLPIIPRNITLSLSISGSSVMVDWMDSEAAEGVGEMMVWVDDGDRVLVVNSSSYEMTGMTYGRNHTICIVPADFSVKPRCDWLIIPVPPTPPPTPGPKTISIVVGTVAAIVVVLILFLVVSLLVWHRKKRQRKRDRQARGKAKELWDGAPKRREKDEEEEVVDDGGGPEKFVEQATFEVNLNGSLSHGNGQI